MQVRERVNLPMTKFLYKIVTIIKISHNLFLQNVPWALLNGLMEARVSQFLSVWNKSTVDEHELGSFAICAREIRKP